MKRSRDDFDSDDLTPADSPNSSQVTNSPPRVKIIRFAEEAIPQAEVVQCLLPGHPELSFSTYEDYESHYNQWHLWRCQSCRRNFPSEHYLNLHIEENHDSMAKVRLERGEKIYACFLPECSKKCGTPYKRQMHLRFGHDFPKDYDFQLIRTGINGHSSLLTSGRPKNKNRKAQQNKQASNGKPNGKPSRNAVEKPVAKQSTTPLEQPDDNSLTKSNRGLTERRDGDFSVEAESTEKMDEDQSTPSAAPPSQNSQPDTEMEDITSAMSSLKFVPRGIRFGRGGKSRGGFSRS